MDVVLTFTASLMRARPAFRDVQVSRTQSLLPAMKKPDELEIGEGSRLPLKSSRTKS
jgi:hypothetical protein